VENLAHAVSLHFMHYNFARPHQTLTKKYGKPDHPGDDRGRRERAVVAHAARGTAGMTQVEDVRCRPAGAEDFTFLATMLGEAAVWRPDKPTPTADQVLADPRYALYLAGWPRQGDYGLVAEQDGPVGAAWNRTFTEASHGYGFVAEDVPELAIAVIASRRHEGIGRRLLVDLIEASVAQGYAALSLSVNDGNPARGLYESVGFQPVENRGSSWTMLRHAAQSN
jgi:ribosomal protein S18 acetylase RimI-like enzyme